MFGEGEEEEEVIDCVSAWKRVVFIVGKSSRLRWAMFIRDRFDIYVVFLFFMFLMFVILV